VQQEKSDSESKLAFERKRIEEMETQIKVLTRKNEDAVASQLTLGGGGPAGGAGVGDENHPEVLLE
jgi:hypothetical protein